VKSLICQNQNILVISLIVFGFYLSEI